MRCIRNLRSGDRFDEGAGEAEVDRILPASSGDKGRDGRALVPNACIGILRLARAGNEFLHDDGVLSDQGDRLVVSREQAFAIVGAPSLGAGEIVARHSIARL